MVKKKRVVITVLIVLLFLISILGIVSYKNGNTFISKIISVKKAEIEDQMQTDLENAISALQIEKNGSATLDDVTQEWAQTNLSTYTCTFINDITISGKKLKIESGDVNARFIVNQDLTVTKTEKTYPSIEYQVEETDGNILKVLVIAEDSINGIKRIVCPDGNIINASGERTKKPIAINYTMDKDQDYLFQLILDDDDNTITDKTIRIDDYYYNITKTLGQGLSISNNVTKTAYNESYQATIIAEENYVITSLNVTMGGEIVTVTDGQINIEHVTGDIVINVTSKEIARIVYDGNGATSGNMADGTAYIGENFTLAENTYIKTNYVFTGWNTEANGSGQAYTDKQAITAINLTLYAQWRLDVLLAGTYTSGQTVKYKGEEFFVIEDKGSNVVALSMFCLDTYALKQYDIYTTYNTYQSFFSSTNYWSNYFTSSPFDLQTSAMLTKIPSGDTFNDNAIKCAQAYGASKGVEGRLMTYDEANSLISLNSEAFNSIMYGKYTAQGYLRWWLGAANDVNNLWIIDGYHSIMRPTEKMDWRLEPCYNVQFGVRPVLIIPET